MHCPKCGMPSAKEGGAASCPRCGVVFAKVRSRERPAPSASPPPTPRPAPPRQATAGTASPSRTSNLINVLLLVIALGAAAVWLERTLAPPPAEPSTEAATESAGGPTNADEDARITGIAPFPENGADQAVPGPSLEGPALIPAPAPATEGATGYSVRDLPRLDPSTMTPTILARAIDFAENAPDDPSLRDYVANAHVYLSAREVSSRRYREALRYLEGAEAWGAPRGEVATIRALVYGHQESWSSAEQWARTALAEGTSEPAEMHHLIGKAQYFREELGRAIASFEQAIAIDDNPRFRASLAAAARDSRSAASYDQKRLSHFIVSYEGETMETTGRMVLDTMERSYAALVSQFGFEPPEPVVVLLYSRQDYAQMGGPHWSAGYFDGKIRVPVRGLTRVNPQLQATLHHELAHAFIHAQSGQNAPRWLHEGIAQYVDGTDARRAGPYLAQALERNRTLEGCIRSAQCDVRVFYAAASSAVEYMVQQRGMGGIKDLVRELGEGKDIDTAMRNVLGKDQSSFFRDWEHFVRRRFG